VNTRDRAFSRAEVALERERRAIVSLDVDEVERAAEEKQAAFMELAATATKAECGEVAKLLEAARHNCLLLAHARDLTSSVLSALDPARAEAASLTGGKPATRRGVRLSITG
jgi:hypothetical protein